MINGYGIFGLLLENLWGECENTYTLLNNILDNKYGQTTKYSPPQSPYQLFYINIPNYFSVLRVFVEIRIFNTTYLGIK